MAKTDNRNGRAPGASARGRFASETEPGDPPRFFGGAAESNHLVASMGLRPLNLAGRYGPRLLY